MLKVGLTGGIASGKSTVAQHFETLGVPVLRTDAIARELTAPNTPALEQIKQHFGESYLSAQGTLDRKKLGRYIFSHPDERRWLEQLLHPRIRDVIKAQLRTLKAPYCIIEIPLLTESKNIDYVDRVLVVDAPKDLQIQRLQQRDQASQEEIENILAAQSSREARLKRADDVILNDGDAAMLLPQIEKLHLFYTQSV